MRRGLTWLLVAPLVLLGSQAGHASDYWLAAPGHDEREHLLEETGHGYLHHAPAAIALCVGLIVLALGGRLLETYRGEHPGQGLSPAPFAVLPIVAFALQEHLERLLHDGSFPVALGLEPVFLVGLALQLPFALLAFLVGRALLEVADVLARALGSSVSVRPASTPRSPRPAAAAVELPRLSPLATACAVRGPPLTR